MTDLIFVTGNSGKFLMAQQICGPKGLTLEQKNLDIDEVQSEDPEYIARKKAEAAFDLLQQPLIVRDDSWSLPGLRGFPGPYMKSINHWFTDDDFINLTRNLTDRRAILTQTIAFTDGKIMKILSHETTAYILTEARGNSESPSENVLTIEGDGGLSISEVMAADARHEKRAPAGAWHDFIAWYKEYAA